MAIFQDDSLSMSGFSWQNMLSLATLSKYSYESKNSLEKLISTGWNVEITASADVGDTQGYVLENDNFAILVYRGTESLGDWLTNVTIIDTPGSLGNVHKGFLDSFNETKDILIPPLQTASSSGKTIWMTGHSLGGAVALNAAIETRKSVNLSGIATFGQPRVARKSTAIAIQDNLGKKYYRFVNNDDVVPRIPPLHSHAGQLFHFDGYGQLAKHTTETDGAEGSDSEPLTELEFHALQETIEEINASINETRDEDLTHEGRFGDLLGISLEGLLPSIADHSIDRYLTAIRKTMPPETSVTAESENLAILSSNKNSGWPESFAPVTADDDALGPKRGLGLQSPRGDNGSALATDAKLPLLLEVTTSWEPTNGLIVCSQYQNITTVLANENEILALTSDPNVTLIEHSRDAGILELDTSISFVNGNAVQSPEVNERGEAAIVGIIDTGIDILHNSFMNELGNETRLIAIWDQRDGTGPTPKEAAPQTFSQDYGTLHTRDALNQKISQHQTSKSAVSFRLRDPQAHGTHVAGIAAGRGTEYLDAGMAPDSPLILVIPNLSQERGSPRSVGYSNSHVDALAFLKQTAQGDNILLEKNMPIAINVSLGMNAGAHDGSTLLEAAFDTATNLGRTPGIVIVKSAGNERNHAGHAQIQAVHGGIIEIAWDAADEPRHEDYFEAWFNAFDDLAFRVIDPSGNESEEITFETPNITSVLSGNFCTLSLIRGYRDNGDSRLTLRVVPQASPIQHGVWKLAVHGRNVASPLGVVDVWVERSQSRAIRFKTHDERMTLSVPGTAKTVITVGATDTQKPWRLNPSSSYGPTRSGHLKPDICAPGFEIKSAKAGQDDPNATIALSGTSMAAPHVVGALALALSRIAKTPGAEMPNAVQLGSALRRTVQGGRLGVHHPGSGYGLLDAEALFKTLT